MAQKLRTPPAFPVDPHLVFSIHAGWLTTTCHGNSRRPLILFRTLSVVDIPSDTPPLKTDFYSLSSYQLKKTLWLALGLYPLHRFHNDFVWRAFAQVLFMLLQPL